MAPVEIEVQCAPLQRPEKIEALLGSAEQYAEASVPVLEGYVTQQVSGKTYDALANKALVKLYQFTPSRCNDEILALVLAKAMMARPSGDITEGPLSSGMSTTGGGPARSVAIVEIVASASARLEAAKDLLRRA